ncbi:SPW repeat protein [Chelativorans sp.]|uniref:SPW repeat domain-containing protein n=1 Tax=Chelativorans sp. TaxID=2203393 RepID=UPI00281246C0|nr:SPW repeat protein [Chelativorans sp.]
MQIIPTRTHGVLDYLVGLLLIAAPWLLGFADGGPAQWVPVILGLAAIIYSLLTNYELGVVKLIPMPGHLALDIGSGLLLAASPWLFGFADVVAWPHLVFGLLEIAIAAFTHRRPDYASLGQNAAGLSASKRH